VAAGFTQLNKNEKAVPQRERGIKRWRKAKRNDVKKEDYLQTT